MRENTLFASVGLLMLLVFSCTPRHSTLLAYDQAEDLEQSVLLVPLPSAEHQAQRFDKYGETKKAQRLREKYAKPNLRVMSAFKQNFNYCPVWFYFYPFDSNRSYTGQMALFDADGTLQNLESGKKYYHVPIEEIEEQQNEREEVFTALVIKDSQMRRLKPPFPVETRIQGYPSQNSLDAAVRKLQLKLTKLNEKRHEVLKK